LIIIAEEVEGQALAALIMNAMRGTLKVAAIKAPLYGEERRHMLHDIAISTGATFISRESGQKLQETQMHQLGSAKFIESTKYFTTIVGGFQDYEQVEKRIESLKSRIEQTDELQECESIQSRITRLNSGVAVIRVGGSTEVEMIEKKHRIEDALEAVRAAQEEGIVPGGGCALARASNNMVVTTKPSDDSYHSDQMAGLQIVREACRDFRNGKIVNLIEKGIIDPVKVTRIALENAASCAGTLLTTNFGIVQGDEG
jgi:chaperonin GroEL